MSDETKVKVLTAEDLMNIDGGTDENGTRISGMDCPSCKGFIPISMYQIISGSSIFCPHCCLRLDIDRASSMKTIEELRRLHEQLS